MTPDTDLPPWLQEPPPEYCQEPPPEYCQEPPEPDYLKDVETEPKTLTDFLIARLLGV